MSRWLNRSAFLAWILIAVSAFPARSEAQNLHSSWVHLQSSVTVTCRKIFHAARTLKGQWQSLENSPLHTLDGREYFFKIRTREGEKDYPVQRFSAEGNPVILISESDIAFEWTQTVLDHWDDLIKKFGRDTDMTRLTNAKPVIAEYNEAADPTDFPSLILSDGHHRTAFANGKPIYVEIFGLKTESRSRVNQRALIELQK